jgi:hypothetical protein
VADAVAGSAWTAKLPPVLAAPVGLLPPPITPVGAGLALPAALALPPGAVAAAPAVMAVPAVLALNPPPVVLAEGGAAALGCVAALPLPAVVLSAAAGGSSVGLGPEAGWQQEARAEHSTPACVPQAAGADQQPEAASRVGVVHVRATGKLELV